MKRTIGLMALMLTAVAAFAQPAARDRNDYDRRPVVVERGRVDYNRRPAVAVHRDVRDLRRDPYCR
jgi:hypothetical protein